MLNSCPHKWTAWTDFTKTVEARSYTLYPLPLPRTTRTELTKTTNPAEIRQFLKGTHLASLVGTSILKNFMKFKSRQNLKSVTGRPSTPFRPRISLLPRRVLRTGMETQPAPIEEHLAGGSSSSEVEKGPEPPAPSGDLAFLGGGSMELNTSKGCLDLGPDAQEQGPQNGTHENPACQPGLDLKLPMTASEQSTLPVIYVGNVKLQTGLVDDIAGAFLQSSRKTLHFVPPDAAERGNNRPTNQGSGRQWVQEMAHYCSGLSSGRRPYFPQLESYARANWKGLQHVSATSSGFFFFRFHTRIAMEDVIEGGPWLFQGQPIVLQCWEQGMSLRRQQHTHVPVWIRLKHLPMEYWTEEGLSTVASGIGTPLYSDGITKDCSRLDYAGPILRNGKEDRALTLSMNGCLKNAPIVAHWVIWKMVVRLINTELAGVATSVSTTAGLLIKPVSGRLMIKAASWNVRGLNGLDHQRAVEQLVSDHKLTFIGLIETRVSQVNVQRVRRNLLLNWSWFDDYAGPEGRIWLAWNPLEVGVDILRVESHDGPRSLWKRLDRMLANTSWMDAWPSSSYISALPSTSDHSPLILAGMNREDIWKHRIAGTAMYDTVCKLKLLKPVFRQQKRLKGNLTENVKQAKHFLDKAQGLFTTYKEDIFLDLVKSCRRVYSVAVKLEISMLQQRAKLRWLKHGDQSSKIFFRKINTTRVKQRIFQITKVDGELLTAQHDVNQEFISYFQNLLGGPSLQRRIDLEFLRHELKHTITPAEASLLVTPVTLSEVSLPRYVSDFRPIACCNVLYKSITKIIVKRLQQVLPLLIDSQNAFVPGRSITDNILLAQELMAGYNQKRLPSRSSFSVSLNGSIHGFFKGGRGLRQGDPMSPYLFVLVMEIWTLLLRFRIKEAADFQYHWKWLKVNPAKSQIIFSRAVQQERQQILDYLGFQEGSLPVKYLGIPLTSSRLTIADCRPLIDKVDARLAGWNNQTLSYAGRLQLIKSVLTTLHTYWASAFILPKGVLKTLEKKMRQFLWHGSAGRRNAKVAWAWISKPKEEGGLGIRSLTTTNQALMLKQLWRILQNDGTSIWVDWIQRYRLRNSTIWTFNGALGSWGWKKMLKLRHLFQRGVIYKIGDGSSFSLWQDAWDERGPLCLIFPRGPEVTGLPLTSSLSSVIQNNQWCWPASTDTDIIGITSHLPPLQSSAADCISWRSSSGDFTFQAAVSLIQPTTPRVSWYVLSG
ncbi:UNVERIFIED_CONTAM: hypothetical protein Scaly_3129800 [Sesamum calycinum]|uniref:Reverse transcriptase domain-containing protein n=1 Tax=Sesamum calycinum TaxID=2727403 RepID=A0AAW2JKD2_9LAMI